MTDLVSIDKVRRLEEELLELPQVDLQTQMFAHGGMGARTIFVPAGTAITGALTNIANVCIVCGDITVTTNDGMKRFTGYHVLKAESGFKRAGFAHADTWWSTIWPTEKTDAREMEDEMTSESEMLQTRRDGIEWAKRPALEG
jgi:hypothetical protein